jgi:hypothetical protein
MPYPMPNSVIKKGETFGASTQNRFNFVDCNGILFKWNDELDAVSGDALLVEDVVLYPLITAEFLGVTLHL